MIETSRRTRLVGAYFIAGSCGLAFTLLVDGCGGSDSVSIEGNDTTTVSSFVLWEKAASPPSHGFWSIVIAPSAPDTLYVASEDANVWRSTDGGTSWMQLGERLFGAHIFSNVAVHPSDSRVVFASNGSLFVSRDGGESWNPLFGSGNSLGVVSVAFAPDDPRVLYAGDDRSHLYRSDDTGATWSDVGALPSGGDLTELWVDPMDPNVLLAGTRQALYRSADGGTTLVEVLGGDITPRSLTAHATDATTAFVIEGGRLRRSTDGGQSWQELVSEPVRGVAAAGSIIYAATDVDVLTSDDVGLTWSTTGYDAQLIGDRPALAVNPTDPQHIYAVTELTIASSRDGGATWSTESSGLVADDFFTLAVDPSNPDRLYGGLFWTLGMYRSDDGARSWQWLPNYIHTPPGHEHYPMSIGIDPRNSDVIFVTGAYGFRGTRDGGETWTPSIGDFHMHALAISPANPDVLYVGAGLGDVDKVVPGTELHTSTDGGVTWQPLGGGLPTDEDFNIYVIALAPSDPDRLYLGTNLHDWATPHPEGHAAAKGVFRSTDAGATFEVVNNGLTELNVFALAVDPRDADVVYAGTAAEGAGNLFKTVDGGSTWARLGPDLPGVDVHTIALWPPNPDVIAVGFGQNVQAGTGLPVVGAGVYVSEDAGQTWTNASEGLSEREFVVMSLVFSGDGTLLYGGTDDGVFRGTVLRD